MEVSNGFKAVIKAYLDDRARDDELFAATYAKQGKSLDECCNYILQEVKKSGQNGFADEEIFGMAVHYYDEDDIKVKPLSGVRVSAATTTEKKPAAPEYKPTKKDRENAKKAAMERLIEEERAKIGTPRKRQHVEPVQSNQMSLFAL